MFVLNKNTHSSPEEIYRLRLSWKGEERPYMYLQMSGTFIRRLKIWESDIRLIYRIKKIQLDSPTNSEDVEIWESIYRIKVSKLRCRFTDKYFWDATQSRRSRVEVVCASVPSSQFEFLPYTSCSSVCGVSHSATNFTFISSKYAIKEGQMLKTNLSWYFKKKTCCQKNPHKNVQKRDF